MTTFRSRLYARLFTAAVVLAGLAGTHHGFAAEPNQIVMKDFDFAPMTISIKPGTTVTWKNLDGEPHTVVSEDGLFRSQALDEDEAFTFKFDKPGTYKFLCSIHPKMRGIVEVK
jgi:plastocyanin